MDESLWYKELHDLDLEELVQLKQYIRQGKLPDSEWHKKSSAEDTDGVTMDEWIEILEKEFKRLGI